MRNWAYVFSLVLSLGLALDAHAQSKDLKSVLGTSCDGLPDSADADAVAALDASQSAYSKICRDQARIVCANENLSGCNQYVAIAVKPNPLNFEQTETVPAAKKIAEHLEALPKQNIKFAQQCCSDGHNNCPMSHEATAAQARIAAQKPSDTADKGANQLASADQTANQDQLITDANLAGTCRAYRSLCIDNFMELAEKIQKLKCAQEGKEDCQTFEKEKESKYAEAKQKCNDLQTQSVETVAITTSQRVVAAKATQAQASNNPGAIKTQSTTPSTTPNGSTQPTEKTASGGGDGSGSSSNGQNNSMGQMAMQMMQAMMAQKSSAAATPAAAASTATQDCSSNPMLAGCTAAKSTIAISNGSGGMTPASKNATSGGTFGLGDNGDVPKGSALQPDSAGSNNPITTKTVQNGGGGFSGGGGGGGSSGGGGGGSVGAGMARTSTDILHGEGGGGGGSSLAATAQGMNMQTSGGGGGGGNYGAGNADGFGVGMQLADFLPGGRKDPARNIASVNGAAPQIQAKTVNIWSRISEHIQSRCAQGLLRDCGPK